MPPEMSLSNVGSPGRQRSTHHSELQTSRRARGCRGLYGVSRKDLGNKALPTVRIRRRHTNLPKRAVPPTGPPYHHACRARRATDVSTDAGCATVVALPSHCRGAQATCQWRRPRPQVMMHAIRYVSTCLGQQLRTKRPIFSLSAVGTHRVSSMR